jgi:hypothetical protein
MLNMKRTPASTKRLIELAHRLKSERDITTLGAESQSRHQSHSLVQSPDRGEPAAHDEPREEISLRK